MFHVSEKIICVFNKIYLLTLYAETYFYYLIYRVSGKYGARVRQHVGDLKITPEFYVIFFSKLPRNRVMGLRKGAPEFTI